MLLAALLTFASGAVGAETAVVVGRRTSLSPADAQVLAQTISSQLTAAGVAIALDADAARASLNRLGVKDAAACNGRKACLTELGRQLATPWLITLSLSQVGNDRSIALELLRVADGVVLEQEALILSTGATVTADQLTPFAARARARLEQEDRPVMQAPVPPPVVTAPLVKEPPPGPVVLAPIAPPPRSRASSIVLGGAAVVALAVATGLLVSGLNERAEAYRTTEVEGALRSPYPASEVERRAASGGVQLGIAGGLAAAGLGLGVAAVITW